MPHSVSITSLVNVFYLIDFLLAPRPVKDLLQQIFKDNYFLNRWEDISAMLNVIILRVH